MRDIKDILVNGFLIKDRLIAIKLSSIIWDAPAKCFIKQTKQFNGFYGCDRCKDPGKIFKLEG